MGKGGKRSTAVSKEADDALQSELKKAQAAHKLDLLDAAGVKRALDDAVIEVRGQGGARRGG